MARDVQWAIASKVAAVELATDLSGADAESPRKEIVSVTPN
jgi:hypothetical protein